MQLVVKQSGRVVNEFSFAQGPVYLGRMANSQVFLPDRAVSKQHAVITKTDNGKWSIEDLDSANKTHLNDKAIKKAQINSGDVIQIADFIIEVNVDDKREAPEPAHSEDTIQLEASLATPAHDIVVRKPDAGHAPAMRLPAKRLTDFTLAAEKISAADNIDDLLLNLLEITLKQFSAFHVWCALREQPTGPMLYYSGKKRAGQSVQLSEIKLQDKITQAVEKGQSLVLPRVSAQLEGTERIRSALIASIMRPVGCFGVIYVDNAMIQEHYTLGDLDYLMLLAIQAGSMLKRLIKT
ncbi:FHA domain-containing protein [Planctomycetota bacterium]